MAPEDSRPSLPHLAFIWELAVLTQALALAKWTLYGLSHLPSLSLRTEELINFCQEGNTFIFFLVVKTN